MPGMIEDMDQLQRDPVFQSLPRPTLLLDTDFVIRAANQAYLAATAREADELVEAYMFDAFPDNPDDPEADGVANLNHSLEQAARARRPDNMLVQRYDLLDAASGEWSLRHWSPLNTPVIEDDRVVGLLHQVEDVTPFKDLQTVMTRYRDLERDDEPDAPETRALADVARGRRGGDRLPGDGRRGHAPAARPDVPCRDRPGQGHRHGRAPVHTGGGLRGAGPPLAGHAGQARRRGRGPGVQGPGSLAAAVATGPPPGTTQAR